VPVKGSGSILPALLALGVIAGACRRQSAAADAEVRAPEAERIVPGNAAAAEFLAVLLGDGGAARVAAMPEQVDAYSSLDFLRPPWKAIARFSRYGAETLIAMHPDLVVTHEWQAAETTQILRAQGIPVLVLPSARSYAEVRGTLEELGRTLGLEDRARATVEELDRRVGRLREGAAGRKDLRVLEYANNGTGGWTAGADTTFDAMIRMAGLRNAAAEAGLTGHVVLDLERLVAIDPDVIVAGTPARDEAGSPTKDILEKTPALANLSAVKKGRVLVLSAKLLSADSPCLVDAAERLAAEVDARIAGAPGPAGK
jgi:ABC-type Fe3+-hydroxamate transport system substrate-binding protein